VLVMYVCLPFPCIFCDCLNGLNTYLLLKKKSEDCCYCTHSILNPFRGFVSKLITVLGKWRAWISCMDVTIEILGKHIASTQNIIHNAESSHQTSPASERIWALSSTPVELHRYGSSHTDKSRRRCRYQCAKNCSCWVTGVPLVWRILREQSLYPYHIQLLLPLTIVQGRCLSMASRKVHCKHTVCS
jgi:hypothetical protein